MQDDFFEAMIDRKKHAKPKNYTSKFYFNFRKRREKKFVSQERTLVTIKIHAQ